MTFDPGVYKIQIKDSYFGRFSYKRVYLKQGKKYFSIDHGYEKEFEKDHEDFDRIKIIKKLARPVRVKNVRVKVLFDDQDGDSLELVARSMFALRRIFKKFPGLIKKLGERLPKSK